MNILDFLLKLYLDKNLQFVGKIYL